MGESKYFRPIRAIKALGHGSTVFDRFSSGSYSTIITLTGTYTTTEEIIEAYPNLYEDLFNEARRLFNGDQEITTLYWYGKPNAHNFLDRKDFINVPLYDHKRIAREYNKY